MKRLVSYVKESVFDPIKTYGDILTPEELNYRFVVLEHPSGNVVKKIIENDVKHYQKDPEENAKKLKKEIEIDKFLADHDFSNDIKCTVRVGGVAHSDIYQWRSPINKKGYCVVYDPYGNIYKEPGYVFLVTLSRSKVGKTLDAIEWVESDYLEEENHKYESADEGIPRVNKDNIKEAWEYIEKKYGRF